MILRGLMLSVLCCTVFAAKVDSQPGDRYLDMKAQVLDLVFPMDVSPKPYFLKIVLRYGDSDTQITVVIYPGGKSEALSYSLVGMDREGLSGMISKMVAANPKVTAHDIATKLKVNTTRSPVQLGTLNRMLSALKGIHISPALENRVAVDESTEYEYWYDTGEECVYYALTGPPDTNDPEDQLVHWMIKFRANLPNLLKASSARIPSP